MKEIKTSQGESTGAAFQCRTNTPRRILVVEEDKDIRHLNTEVLMDFGYEVAAAENGAVAWEALHAGSYDLLITDNKMLAVTGIELIKKIRAEGMRLPVILTSGKMPTEELNRRPWLQIQAMLHKPYTLAEFLNTVKEVLCATAITCEPIALSAVWPVQLPTLGLRRDDFPACHSPLRSPLSGLEPV